jgi:hypothetical protein
LDSELESVNHERFLALWYSVGSEDSMQSFLAHADQISIVSPQVFSGELPGYREYAARVRYRLVPGLW